MNRLSAKVSPSPAPSPNLLQLPAPTEDGQRQRDGDTDLAEGDRGGDLEEGEAEGGKQGCCAHCRLRAIRRVACGLVLGGCVALVWAGGTHSARLALQLLPAPFFITWFCCTWNLLLFPLHYLMHLLGAGSPHGPATHIRRYAGFLADEPLTVRGVVRGVSPFAVLWNLSGYLYLLSLRHIAPGDACAVLCCSQAFHFLLAWIGLNHHFMGVRIVAAILSITGIVMLAYADGFHSESIKGVALAVGSASTSAIYKVLFKKCVGEEQSGAASVLLTCVGLCSCVLHSWVCVVLYLTHVEYWPLTQHLPWDHLCGTAALLLGFNVLVHLGAELTYPSLLSLGMLLSVPASTVLDIYLGAATQLSQVRVAAAGIIAVGYLLLLLPEHWDERVLGWAEGLWQGT
ncbi:putative thiamine transporter SLC35F3 [Hypomesus transpacificus]|uniref:putative thiamine transporter SLC35F3 n=1 Tax=Hypomesus transpacificus TaxID=137520 RepID=UPI001F084C62|nr:putative thiamine transporter SLC35F3 [Hypomesus transpacificus]